MTTAEPVNIKLPKGRCKACGQVVPLASPRAPVLVPGGRLVVNGLCPTCSTEVVAFQSATPWDALDGGRLNPMVVGILCMGLRAGFQQASEMAKQQRADDIFRAQKKLRATYRQIGDLFDLSAAGVAQAIADARRRAEAESGLRESVLDGRKRGRTRWQTAREHGLTKRGVSSALAKARRQRDIAHRNERVLRWRERGWSYARLAKKFGMNRKDVLQVISDDQVINANGR